MSAVSAKMEVALFYTTRDLSGKGSLKNIFFRLTNSMFVKMER